MKKLLCKLFGHRYTFKPIYATSVQGDTYEYWFEVCERCEHRPHANTVYGKHYALRKTFERSLSR